MLASSQVAYGLLSTSEVQTAESDISPRVLSHSMQLTNLVPCTKYVARVRSEDAEEQVQISNEFSFVTTGCDADASVHETNTELLLTDQDSTTELVMSSSRKVTIDQPAGNW